MINDINVLIVDDEEDMCWALENILKKEGYNIIWTTSGDDAISLMKKNTFNTAFIDIKLPDMDGIELARCIKKEDNNIRIIMISGYYYEDDRIIQEGLHDGIYLTFIGKPFDINEVRKAAQYTRGK